MLLNIKLNKIFRKFQNLKGDAICLKIISDLLNGNLSIQIDIISSVTYKFLTLEFFPNLFYTNSHIRMKFGMNLNELRSTCNSLVRTALSILHWMRSFSLASPLKALSNTFAFVRHTKANVFQRALKHICLCFKTHSFCKIVFVNVYL